VAANRDALRQWSQSHDDYDVDRSRLVRRWLLMVNAIAAPLARRQVPPNAVTTAGVAAAVGAALSARSVSARSVSAPLVLLTALCDGFDGAVALQRGRRSRHGTLVDHGADRVTDVLFAVALWRAGAHRWAAAADAALVIGHETTRSVLRRRGGTPGVVTVGERPVRVAVTAIGIAASPTGGATAVALLSAAGLLQLLTAG
jgi:phosphatidylglycerophosphate synthase